MGFNEIKRKRKKKRNESQNEIEKDKGTLDEFFIWKHTQKQLTEDITIKIKNNKSGQ